jgi:hypothetical protein
MITRVTFDTVRKIASGLPGVEESTSYGVPSFKVGGKLLACPAINKSAEPNSLGVWIDVDQRDALLAEAPDTYYTTHHYAGHPVVLVRLSKISSGALRDLLYAGLKFVSKSNRPKPGRKRRGASRV